MTSPILNRRIITQFRDEHYFLSNYSFSEFTMPDQVRYSTAETAYQAHKVTNFDVRHRIAQMSPKDAKNFGRTVKLRPMWNEIRRSIMRDVVKQKFLQNHHLRKRLISTGTHKLEEGNYWGDTYWGVDLKTGRGENHLGQILMELREEFKNESQNS